MLNHGGTAALETDRLILRRYEMRDAEDVYNNWATDPEVSRFWEWEPHGSIDETKALIAGWIEEYNNLRYYHWIIVLKSIAQAVGYIYLDDIDDENNSVSVHFALSRKYWNNGIMTEACRAVIDFAFTVLKAEKVHSYHHIENPASGTVQHKCGMNHVKTSYRRIANYEQLSGDYCYYEITLSDWKAQNGK